MHKQLICIECPKGCVLHVTIQRNKVKRVTGNKCIKGKKYAYTEIEHPMRVLTTTVATKGLAVPMLPVKTDKPIPKKLLLKAMNTIRKIRIKKPVKAGDIVIEKFDHLAYYYKSNEILLPRRFRRASRQLSMLVS